MVEGLMELFFFGRTGQRCDAGLATLDGGGHFVEVTCTNLLLVRHEGVAYVERVQEPEFAARDRGYTFVSHQQEVGTGYFDEVTTAIQGGQSSVTALTGSTEEEQFH